MPEAALKLEISYNINASCPQRDAERFVVLENVCVGVDAQLEIT
jgi:hypothetical protein